MQGGVYIRGGPSGAREVCTKDNWVKDYYSIMIGKGLLREGILLLLITSLQYYYYNL